MRGVPSGSHRSTHHRLMHRLQDYRGALREQARCKQSCSLGAMFRRMIYCSRKMRVSFGKLTCLVTANSTAFSSLLNICFYGGHGSRSRVEDPISPTLFRVPYSPLEIARSCTTLPHCLVCSNFKIMCTCQYLSSHARWDACI